MSYKQKLQKSHLKLDVEEENKSNMNNKFGRKGYVETNLIDSQSIKM